MNKTLITTLVFSLVLIFSSSSYASHHHISEELSVNYRTGPSNKYRISGSIKSGEKITVIDDKSSRRFIKIEMADGRQGWVATAAIKTGLSHREVQQSLQTKLTANSLLLAKQSNTIHRLTSLLNEQREKNNSHTNKQSLLTSKINHLTAQVNNLDDSNFIRWMTHIGVVVLFAIFLLSVVSALKKRRNYNQIY